MADAVYGTGVVLSMMVGETYYPILCATDTTYDCGVEFIEKTGPSSGGARQWARRLEEHISTITGLTKIENDDVLSFFYVLNVGIRREDQLFKLVFEDSDGNDVAISGYGLIGAMGINGPAGDFSTATIEIRWNDDPDIEVVAPPGLSQIQDPLYLTLSAGNLSVAHLLLTDPAVEILEVTLEGTQFDVILSGTPGNRECKFTNGPGSLTFEYTEVVDRGVYVLYQK